MAVQSQPQGRFQTLSRAVLSAGCLSTPLIKLSFKINKTIYLRMVQVKVQKRILPDRPHLLKRILQVGFYLRHVADVQVKWQPFIQLRILLVLRVKLQKRTVQTTSQVHMRCHHQVHLESYQNNQRHVDCRPQRKPVDCSLAVWDLLVFMLASNWVIVDHFGLGSLIINQTAFHKSVCRIIWLVTYTKSASI